MSSMTSRKNLIALVGILVLTWWLFGSGRCALAQNETSVFFSQGQAVYDPQDLAKSQQEALKDLMVQGVTQALAEFLSPSQMGSHYAMLQEKILKKPERYVQTYQIFSEKSAEGLYRIVGQVTVSTDILKSDLEQLGLAVTESPAEGLASGMPAQPSVPLPPAAGTETPPMSGVERPGAGAGPVSKEPVAEKEILWAVAEKWDDGWIVAEASGDARAIFAMSVQQESEDYQWTLHFPGYGAVRVNPSGSIGKEEIVSLARSLGLQKALVGSVVYRRNMGESAVIEALMRVLDVSSGQFVGEVQKQYSLPQSSDYEAAMRLAYLIVPQLDGLIRKGSGTGALSDIAREGTGWTVIIRSEYPYAYWERLEKVLREQYGAMQVKSLEVDPQGAKVRVEGVGADFASRLQDLQMREDLRMQVSAVSPENRAVEITFFRF